MNQMLLGLRPLVPTTPRAERRRQARAAAKAEQYRKSGFKGGRSRWNRFAADFVSQPDFGRSKYMPHIGAKERAKRLPDSGDRKVET